MKARLLVAIAATVAVLGAAGWALSQRGPRAPAAAAQERLVVTTAVKRQDLLVTVNETGVVAAKNSTPAIPDVAGRIQFICGHGLVVKRG
ncbi:MAG: hypothetical protein MUQ65_16715, partial [Armatimonadetes bacterium]|nr:hypothetical protein [Armatimonadota bacterium]